MKESDERTTPKEFFDLLNGVFKFELDAAATDENTLCAKWYTMENSGLDNPWANSTFCNPPYSRGEIMKWVIKAYWENLELKNSVLLLPGDISTKWFSMAHHSCTAMFGKKHRLKFNGNKNLAKFGTILAFYGYSTSQFAEFEKLIEGNWLKHYLTKMKN